MSQMNQKYELVIGIETHVQLRTRTKLFCGCDNDSREAEPNTNVCPVCMGFPGALPVLNEQAIKLALRAGLALGAVKSLVKSTKFDRKNYFYPDLPSGYQITQFDQPIVGEGVVNVPDPEQAGETFAIGITRAHLEADAGKLTHPAGADYSLVDLNRSGTPLLEIVSEPDIRSAVQAKAYATEIYNLMRYAGVSDANLYYGNMRFDVNVSVRPVGTKEFGTRSETKNLNSFRSVERAVSYEYQRQVELLEKGERVVQETRGWDDAKQQTFSQRSKEDAHDYRYFPEPDLPPVIITEIMLEEAKKAMPILPGELRQTMATQGIGPKESEILVGNIELGRAFGEAVQISGPAHAQRICNWLVGDVLRATNADTETVILPDGLPAFLAELAEAVAAGTYSSNQATDLINAALSQKLKASDGVQVAQLAGKLGISSQISDESELEAIVDRVISDNSAVADQFRSGETKVLGFLVGQVMKASGGQANPAIAGLMLRKKLKA